MPLGIDLTGILPAGLPTLNLPAAVTPPETPPAPQGIVWAEEAPPALVVTGVPDGTFLAVDPVDGGVGTEVSRDLTAPGVHRGGLRSTGPWRFFARRADGSTWRGRTVTLPTDAVARYAWEDLELVQDPEGQVVVRGAPPDAQDAAGGTRINVWLRAQGADRNIPGVRQGSAGDFSVWAPPGPYTLTVERASWVGRAVPRQDVLLTRAVTVVRGEPVVVTMTGATPLNQPDVRWPQATLQIAGVPRAWTVFVDGVAVPPDAEGLHRRTVAPGSHRLTLSGYSAGGAPVTFENTVEVGANGTDVTRVDYAATIAAAEATDTAQRATFDAGVLRVLPDGRRVAPLGPVALARHAASPFLAPGAEGALYAEFDPVPLLESARLRIPAGAQAFALYVPAQGMQVVILSSGEYATLRERVWVPAVPGAPRYPTETRRDKIVTAVSLLATATVLGATLTAALSRTPAPASSASEQDTP